VSNYHKKYCGIPRQHRKPTESNEDIINKLFLILIVIINSLTLGNFEKRRPGKFCVAEVKNGTGSKMQNLDLICFDESKFLVKSTVLLFATAVFQLVYHIFV
jgi:hypothetical protein